VADTVAGGQGLSQLLGLPCQYHSAVALSTHTSSGDYLFI
jgi:hypothetical protein